MLSHIAYYVYSLDSRNSHMVSPMHTQVKKMVYIKVLLTLSCSFFVTGVFAQKSSGVINQPVSTVQTTQQLASKNSNDQLVIKKQIEDDVTQSVSALENEVRFLLKPKQEAIIASKMAGEISKIYFNIGQRFKKGDVLVSMKCGLPNARLKAQRAKVREYTFTHKSNQDLLAGNAVSKYDVDISQSQLTHQRALLSEATLHVSNCNIKAPFSGGVVSVDINPFESVSSGIPLVKVIDDSEIVMSLNIPSTFINKVAKGNFFNIVVDETSNTYKAKVIGISPAIDPVSKTIELRAVLTERFPELRPGMSGRARLNFSQN